MLSQDLYSNLTSCNLDEDDSFRTKPHEKKIENKNCGLITLEV
jgi:hypothetical protein